MIRAGKANIEEVLPHIWENAKSRQYCGHLVHMSSKRLLCFAVHGIVCAECGLEGKFFAVEKNYSSVSFHINLYALDKDGKEVLMTQDHVRPKSLGGKNGLDNLRTLCTICNRLRGNAQWFVYLLRCSDNSLYCGMTNNIKGRMREHKVGHGAKYVRSRRPFTLVYSEMLHDMGSALSREAEIKGWDKDAKEALISQGRMDHDKQESGQGCPGKR